MAKWLIMRRNADGAYVFLVAQPFAGGPMVPYNWTADEAQALTCSSEGAAQWFIGATFSRQEIDAHTIQPTTQRGA